MKTTDWYRGDQKPVRVGVYQRRYKHGAIRYCQWDGYGWLWAAMNRTIAERETFSSLSQNLPWRGVEK